MGKGSGGCSRIAESERGARLVRRRLLGEHALSSLAASSRIA